MKVIWQVDDGYIGANVPQYTVIDDEDLEGLTGKARERVINEIVQEDFEQKISWYITGTED